MRKGFGGFARPAPAILIAAVAALYGACGGRVVLEEGASGAGGEGGSTGEGGTTTQASTTAGTTGPSTVTSVGAGPMACASCAEFITEGMGTLCPESEFYYKDLFSCICAESCIPQCGNNLCSGASPSDDCGGCITSACDLELNTCANDF